MANDTQTADDQKIKEVLLKESYVSAADMERAENEAQKKRITITDFLLNEGIITKNLLGQAIAESLNVLFADVAAYQPSKDLVLMIPEDIAKKYHATVFRLDTKAITVATDKIDQNSLLEALKTIFKGKKIQLAFAFTTDIEALFLYYLKTLDTRFNEIIKSEKRVAPEIIEEIIEDAAAFRASDIHLEPQEKEVIIRFRVDGVLHEAGRIPKEFYGNILNRIKVQTQLPIDEHFSAQDGAIRYTLRNNSTADMRISILPTLDGEKVVIRLLSQYVRNFTFSDLGLSERDQESLTKSSKKPFGMILVVGPTGSGKTTSLYALLKLLNKPEVNITTIEDPVEYKVLGVNQIQVNPQTNLTFAHGLRSIARQDPDVILVGEIRDKETAEVAVNAALTGHLLLTTFHANDAATAVPRLLDMGVEPFLLASTLNLIIAQRLVRRICDQCRQSITLDQGELKKLISEQAKKYFPHKSTLLYKGKGCQSCGNTGFRGRIAIYEFIQVTPDIQELVLKNPSTKQIWDIARKQGSQTLFEDGIEKVKNGITTIEELLRVAEPSLD